MTERIKRAAVVIAGTLLSALAPVSAAEPSRGFPYRASPLECVRLERVPVALRGQHRWFVDALARRGSGRDGVHCAITHVRRYGGYPAVATWNVRLRCAGLGEVQETWTQNGDGSVTIDRDGDKTTLRACGR